MAEIPPILSIKGLSKRFGHVRVLEDVSLDVHVGELLLLLGPNGAGKTTLTRILTTLTRAGRGTFLFRGESVTEKNRGALRREIGYISHQTFLYAHLTAAENLSFYGRLYGVHELDVRIGTMLERVGLAGVADRQVGTFSRGMQQRLSLARVLLTDPSILILDEPYTGLDPEGSRTLTKLLAGLKTESRAVLMITHDLEDCLEVADRIAVLHKGRIALDTPAEGLTLESARRQYFQATTGERAS